MTNHWSAKPRLKANHNGNSEVGFRSTELSRCAGIDWIQGQKTFVWDITRNWWDITTWDREGMRLSLYDRLSRFFPAIKKFGHMVNWDIDNAVLTGKVFTNTLCWRSSCHCIRRLKHGWWLDHGGREEGQGGRQTTRKSLQGCGAPQKICQRAENCLPPRPVLKVLCSFQMRGERVVCFYFLLFWVFSDLHCWHL